ncbi:hypothetical protein HY636_06410 [Candidatus Woesearchaeota archaeon]|nr:hypothetical protein [Candidatus Woesearchaeota archaeon]
MAKKEKNKYSVYLFVIAIIIVMFGIAILADYYVGLNSAGESSNSEGVVAEEAGNDLAGKATSLEVYDKCVKECDAGKKRTVDTSAAPKNIDNSGYITCMKKCDDLGNQLNVFWCNDSDGDSLNAKYIKGITYSTYNPGGKVDECYTFFSGKVRLIEGKCVDKMYGMSYVDCEKGCKDGACIK